MKILKPLKGASCRASLIAAPVIIRTHKKPESNE